MIMKVKITATISVKSNFNNLNEEELEWFTNYILKDKENTMLILHSNEIRDEIGNTREFNYEIIP